MNKEFIPPVNQVESIWFTVQIHSGRHHYGMQVMAKDPAEAQRKIRYMINFGAGLKKNGYTTFANRTVQGGAS